MNQQTSISVGPRPMFLIDQMEDGQLKTQLRGCQNKILEHQAFSIAHRGAPLMFPEHGFSSYQAAHTMGAGKQECDVTFTKDGELVCRHSQCDLHQTTDVLLRPELAKQCYQPFVPANESQPAQANCCTSDFTLKQLKQLCIKMDGYNSSAVTAEEFVKGTPSWRTDLFQTCEQIVTHKESIKLFSEWDVDMVPELKTPQVEMPFSLNKETAFTQQRYAQKLVNEYKEAKINPEKVWLQSFDLKDIRYWLKNEPEFAKQAVYLDGRYVDPQFDENKPSTWQPSMKQLKELGLHYIAPPLWVLMKEEGNEIVPSEYAIHAKQAGLKLIAWTLERSNNMEQGGGWYYQTIQNKVNSQGDIFVVLDVLARQVGVHAVFSDWPATTTYYANCMLNQHSL
ncbi:glycerophosphodiester phosphodiesterase [Bermanella marisrubri]|nr:glycerophosphodiester phosphodiesterase [Bermanella marisrubri]